MFEDSSLEKSKVETTRSRKRAMFRWMWAIVASLLVTALTCGLTPVQFASSEQLLLSLATIFATWFVLKVFASRGKFRFVSMLGLMAFTAFLCIYIVAPLQDRTEQRAAIALIRSQGGSVEFGRFSKRYPKEPMGWVPGRNGIPYPAALHYFEENYLHPEPISKLVIPAGLVQRPLLSRLHVENHIRTYVLLDGKGNSQDFEACVREFVKDRLTLEQYGYRPFFFLLDKLHSKDIEFLNGIRTHASGDNLPTLCILSSSDEVQTELLDGLDHGFEIYLDFTSTDSIALRNAIQSKSLQRIVCFNLATPSQIISIVKSRRETMNAIHIPYGHFSKTDWLQLSNLSNVRSLLLYRCFCDGKPLSPENVASLGSMASVEELKIEVEGPDPRSFLETLKIERLKRLTVYSIVNWNDEVKQLIQASGLEEINLSISEQNIEHEPWMNRFRSFRINGRDYSKP